MSEVRGGQTKKRSQQAIRLSQKAARHEMPADIGDWSPANDGPSTFSMNLPRTSTENRLTRPSRLEKKGIEKIVAERRKGLSWAEIACACDLADQSHLAREFRGIIGEGPTEFFAHEIREGTGRMTEANFVVQRSV